MMRAKQHPAIRRAAPPVKVWGSFRSWAEGSAVRRRAPMHRDVVNARSQVAHLLSPAIPASAFRRFVGQGRWL